MSTFTEDVPVHDTALMDDAPARTPPTASLDPDAPTTPAARLNAIASIFAEGIRRRRRHVAISGPNTEPQEGSPARLELSEHDGVTLLTMIAGHEDDRVLSGHWVSHLVQYARWSHPNTLHPVFDRMMRSALPKVAEQGARWVTAENLQCGTCADKYAECRNGTVPQRAGVTTTLGYLLCDERADTTRVEAELTQPFDDPAPEVRAAAAGVFRVEGVLQSDAGDRLAGAFVRSAAFVEHSEDLLWSLSYEAVNLVPFSSSVFAAADRFANELADQIRSI